MNSSASGLQEYYNGFSLVKDQRVAFADLMLTYKGSTPGPFFPESTTLRMGDVLSFEITHEKEAKLIKWSSGTGEISPVGFEIGGKKYELSPYLPAGFEESQARGEGLWYVYPAEPSEDFFLKKPALFISKLEEIQGPASKNPSAFGRLQIQPTGAWKKFSINARRWVGRHLETGYTYSYAMNSKEWLLPPGFYAIRGEGSPDSEYLYLEIRPNERVVAKFVAGQTDFSFGKNKKAEWLGKKRIQAQFGQEARLTLSTVLLFPTGFELGLSRAENHLISFYICFDQEPDSGFGSCATVPSERFKTKDNEGNFLQTFVWGSKTYAVEITKAEPVTVRVQLR